MIKRIYVIIFLFFFGIMYIHALGKMEEQYHRKKLEQYPITVAPISLGSGILHDYVFLDTDRLIMIEAPKLTEINLSTGKQKIIETPVEWPERRTFRNLQYDRVSNSIHLILVVNEAIRTYHILHLDDYSWESVEELGSGILGFYYDSKNMLIYVHNLITYEAFERKTYRYGITTYDFNKREIIDDGELPEKTMIYIYCIYGNPPKILAQNLNQINKNIHFLIYDITTRTHIDYLESDIFYGFNSSSYLEECVPVNEEGSFLCVESRRKGINYSIALVDFNANTLEKTVLEDFPYVIYNLKQIAEGKYSFLVATRNWAGGDGQDFLCFLEYP